MPDTRGKSVSISAARIQEFLQKPTRLVRHSRVVTLLGLVSALLLVSGQGLDNARSSEKAVTVSYAAVRVSGSGDGIGGLAGGAEDVAIPDDVVRKRIELALGKAEGESVTVAEMATLTSLDLSRVVVTDLTGLEHAVNLRELFLGGNAIADLSPLDGLAVAVRHTTAPGVGNLTYGEDEPWQPIATLRAPRTPLNMGYARAFMAGGYLNLIWARDDIDAGIDVWDVSDPRDPVLHRTWDDDRLREAHGLGLWNRDGRIVLAAQSHEGVAFYDVTDVGERLPLLAELDLPGVGAADYGGAWWLSVQAPHVYVATIGGGLHVVDATDPTVPRQVNHLPTGALGGISPGNAYALGNLLVLAAVDSHRGFATMDISDPVNPVLLDTTNGAAGYSHLFAAGLLLSSGNRLNGNRMYVHRVDHDGGIRYVGEAGENLDEGGYGSYQDGHFFSGFTEQVAKFTIDPPAQVGVGTSGIDLRDEDWAQPLGNLILASDDKNVGTALIPHRAAPDATGPEVVWRHPAAGAAGLALTTRIGVSLSDVVAVESLTPANFRVRTPYRSVVAGQLSVNQNNVNFSPDAPLAPSTTYTVEVCHLADLVGNAGGCAGWTFTTRAEETGGRVPTCSLARLAPVEAGVETTYVPASTAYAPAAHTWDFGAGEPVGPQETPAATFTYPAPGRFPVILRVSNAHGASQCSAVQIVHAPVTDVAPVSSSSIVTTVTRVDVKPHESFTSGRNVTDVYVANPDNDTVTRLHWDNTKVWETKVGDNPRTLAAQPDDDLWAPDRIWVANQGSGDISLLNRDGDLVRTIDLGYGAAPYGIVFAPDGGAAYVTLEGSGRLLKLDPETGRTVADLDLGAGLRGIAVAGDSRRIFVTRFVSAFAESDAAGEDAAAGEVYEVDAATFTVTRTIELAFDPGPDTESSGRGVPNYLSQVRIAPDGRTAWIPSKKDNIARGHYRDGNDLDFETQTRAIVSQIDVTANAEAPDRRLDFDDRDLAQALAFTPAGDAVVVAFQGSNVIEVWDANALTRLSEVSVGRAPAGLVFSPDGRRLYVHNFLDRSVTVLNTAGLLDGTVNEPIVVATVSTVAEEALAPEVLRGKRIFYNAADRRMNRDGYLSCASCHLDGGSDGMVWDRTQFGEGLRNTIDLRGRRGTNGGLVHWTANFDEIQDFEHDIRDSFGGSGFMADADFRAGTRGDPLGDPKAGVSAELDALAAYITSLAEVPDSPYRASDGSLTAAGLTGRTVVRDKGCARCHAGADFTDDLMHDVGTIAPSSGQASGAPLAVINTPTLRGLWLSAPYLHDGSLATLAAVLDGSTHMGGALTGEEKSALEAYLLQIDGKESGVTVTDDTPDTTPPAVSSLAISSDPGTDATYAAEDDIQVTVTFSEPVEVTGRPRLQIELGGGSRTATYGGGSGTGALVFEYEVAEGESDIDGVGVEADSLTGGTIRDEAQNDAVLDHDGLAADSGHRVDGVKPRLAASGGAVVDGTTLTLTYDEPLDGSSTPEAGDFTVSGGDQARTVSRVVVRGAAVVLTLDSEAEHGETGILVSYTPGTNRIRDAAGNEAEALSRVPVINDTPDTTPPEVSSLAVGSNPGSDRTYAAGDGIEVMVQFNETVEVEGTPQLRLRVGSRTRTAGYESGTGTAVLVFGYEVAEGDEDTDGVSIEAGRIALNGGTIEDEAENTAELDHEALATQAGHQVDGVRPAFSSAAVDGASLTLTYGEALDGGSRPASGDFTVEVDGSGRSVSGVSVSGSVVTLFLNPAVEHGDTGIRVSYAVPTGVGANPIRDAVGNQARGLSNRSVTNTTGAQNTDPEITSPSSFDVPENQLVARRLAARDADPGDEVTGWAIVGGADRFQFSIAPDTGELSFREAPDYESPADAASADPLNEAGDNAYVVRVEVTSGAGARELEAEQTFTISVTDEREPPGVPEAPTFSGETADSLTVSWTEPENTGPPITDYDVQYREKGTGRFIDGDQQGPGRTLTLEDLESGTVYEVQVRAKNDEGTGDWSDPGEGMTVTPLTLVMASGADPPVSGPFTVRLSFSEPVTGFSRSDVETGQDPACRDDQNNTVFCDPGIGTLQTTDDRVFTATVTPWTDRVAHSYTLRLTVPAGAVRSSVGSKPNEEPEGPLEVRVAPPGVEEPISSLGLTASGGNGSVRLSWNRPSDDGGSPIIRYEYRYQAVGEAGSEWENVGAGTRSVTVGNLVNGREYVFEVRAVNALGKGGAETVQATPELRIVPPRPPPAPRPPGNGDGGGLLFPPEAPAGLMAMPGEGAVRLEWSPPESDGGTPILRYEYRLKEGLGEFGEWTPIEDSAPGEVNAAGYTVGELGKGTVYVFELRAVNLVGNGRVSEAVEVVMGLDRAYWSNFCGEDLEGAEASLEWTPFGGTPRSLRLRFGAGLRFEESELDGEGEVRARRMGGYGFRYTSRTTGELRLDYDGGDSCELRMTFRGEGTGSYIYRCGGALRGQGSFRLSGLNRAPEITGAGVFEVAENRARVGRLEAVDPDEGDGIEGYGIAGGADASLFVIEAETGELRFREAPDYESPSDVESAEPRSGAADNEYIVVVEVRSGEGERERKGSRAIRVRVSDEEEPPEITSVGPFEVAENQAMVGQLEAVDPDEGDEIGGYGIAGGADGGLFAVESETGELLFREAPDYEDPSDVESGEPQSRAADNEYIVVVEVSSGEGERERRGSRAIRVRVSDEEEPPGAPAAPVVTAEGSGSLKVSWTEPENRGPEIVDYEVRYREGGEEGYSDGGHQGTGLEVRLSGLKEGTVYEVQVRAVNQEGMSEWSEPGEGRTDMEEADPDDPSNFAGEELEGRRLTLRITGEEGAAGSLELRFGGGSRFEQIESGSQQAAARSEGAARSGSYTYERTGPGMGTVRLDYDDGSSCEIRLSFTGTGVGGFAYDCGEGAPAEGSFRLTTGSLFVPVILSAAGQNRSFFTSELTLTNRGDGEVKLDYTYTAHRGGGSGKTSDVLAPGMQKIETDALTYLRGLGIAIPETGNRIGTLRVETRLGSEVEAVVRTTTVVPEGRAGLAYLGVAEEEGFDEAVYLCGLRQNSRDRSNLAFQNMGAEEEGAITLRTTVYSGEAGDTSARVLDDVKLEPGGFHQYSGLLGVLGVPAQGYVRVERVEGTSPFYAYGVINDQANSDGSFIFPVAASWLEGRMGQTLPVIVETSAFRSELTVTNFSEEPRTLDFRFVADAIKTTDKTAGFSMKLEAGEQRIIPEVVEELRRQEVAGLGSTRGFYAGAVFATAEEGNMSGIVIGARTGSEGGGGSYSVFYNAVPFGSAFTEAAWVEGLQQNRENRSNLALVNTGEVDGSASVFHLEIYDGETGLLAETVVTKPIPARRWHQINGILLRSGPETRQGYIRILKVSGQNPFLAYGVVNDGGAPGQRSGDGAYLPARE